jgi:hypothetical protein
VAITQVSKMNSHVLMWRRYARTSVSLTVDNPSSISQETFTANCKAFDLALVMQ